MSVAPSLAELSTFKNAPRSRFKGQCFKAGCMQTLHADRCLSPGRDLSSDEFGLAL